MYLAADLHIHSALSPCGDNDMTPNNIVNMAVLKGLDIIAVTDHNNASNLPAFQEVCTKKDILLLPGMEVQTKEEIHMLCYFKNVEDAVRFGNFIYEKLPNIENNEHIFGNQYIFDSMDNIIGSLHKLLLSSADISVEYLIDVVTNSGGICVPAHIDRSTYSIISNLGFIPPNLNITAVEISKMTSEKTARSEYPFLNSYKVLKSSDAHYLWDISERENFLSVSQPNIDSIFEAIKNKQSVG